MLDPEIHNELLDIVYELSYATDISHLDNLEENSAASVTKPNLLFLTFAEKGLSDLIKKLYEHLRANSAEVRKVSRHSCSNFCRKNGWSGSGNWMSSSEFKVSRIHFIYQRIKSWKFDSFILQVSLRNLFIIRIAALFYSIYWKTSNLQIQTVFPTMLWKAAHNRFTGRYSNYSKTRKIYQKKA